ncbi:hypothetical protein N183_37160 [Sinorhizobium sp. Sb3]|nr:hypothetical protein N183_37160 [Sinorhizobium sp. Sb3]
MAMSVDKPAIADWMQAQQSDAHRSEVRGAA